MASDGRQHAKKNEQGNEPIKIITHAMNPAKTQIDYSPLVNAAYQGIGALILCIIGFTAAYAGLRLRGRTIWLAPTGAAVLLYGFYSFLRLARVL